MENQQNTNVMQNNQTGVNAPSLYRIACPQCGSSEYKVLGTKGSKGAAIGIGMAFGAVGNLVANSMNKNDFTLEPVCYRCLSCNTKYETLPAQAAPEEILSAPCVINFKRLSAFSGMAVAQTVWLNGVKVGSVSNGKTITFQTMTKHNVVFVTDQFGKAFKGNYKFEANSGGTVDIRFKRKFKN